MVAKSFLLAVVASAFLAFARADSDVIQLTKDTFNKVVLPEKLILVEFFAPWCGHCKALAPEYEIAATTLKEDEIKIAKVDCTEEAELCQEFEVKGYPTLKVFKSGKPSDFSGARKADGIISYMKKQSLPALSEVNAENIDTFKEADKVVVIAFVSESDKNSYTTFNAVAESLRDDSLFGIVTDADLAKKYNVTAPAAILFKQFDEGRNTYDGPITIDDLTTFVRTNSVPLLDEIDGDNFSIYADSGLPLAYIFVDNDDDREKYIALLQPIAKEFKGKVNFVHIDATKFGSHAGNLNLKEQWPAFAIQKPEEGSKYPFDQSLEITEENIKEFVTKFVAGEIEPSVKTQDIPEVNDEPVKVVVGKQFDEIVYDKEKDVFLEVYAPWCGHCKKLAPTWEELASKLAANPANANLVIAKMDGTENDLPSHVPIRVQGFPTIKLFKAGVEKEIVDYGGDRSYESLVEFLVENASNKPVFDEIKIVKQEEEEEIVIEKKVDVHDEL